jgi:hypothetical protein
MVALRAERLRDLHEQSRNEVKEANAGRRSRRDLHKNGKPADWPHKRAARTKPKTSGTNAARTVGNSAELVNAGSGLTVKAAPRSKS